MSAETHPADSHGDVGHASLRGHLTGFALSAILTALPFYYVMSGSLHDTTVTVLVVVALAAVQIVVHMVFFLHMTPKAEGGWSMMAMIFTVIVLVIALSGSIWVMYHLNANMMPVSAEDMRQMP